MKADNSKMKIKISELENEIKELKITLNQKQILFESLAKHIKIGSALLINGLVMDTNEVFCQKMRIKKEEIIGKSISDFIPSKDIFEQTIGLLIAGKIQKISNIKIGVNNKNIELSLYLSAQVISEYTNTIHVFISETNDNCMHTDLIESEQKYRDLINFAVGGILIGSQDGFIIDANNLACELIGKKYEELIGRHITDNIFCKESIKQSPFRFDLLLKGETVVSRRIIRHKTKKIHIETHTKLMPDGSYQMILHDISERIKAEEKIKESEEKFNLAFNENPIPTVLTRVKDGLIININTACEIESGWTKNEIIGKTSFDIQLWKTEKDRNILIEQLKKRGNIKNFKCSILKKDKTELNVLLSASLININNTPCILSSAIDISSIDILNRKICDNEEKYKFLIENINDLLVQVDSNHKLTYVSDSYCRLFEKTKEELLGKSLFPFIHTDEIEKTQTEIKKLYSPPYQCYLEQKVNTANGWKWIAWSNKAILNFNSNVETIIGLGRDITHQKEIEAQLKKAKDLAEESSRLKSAFLSNMSHEIRTPMNAIMGFAELLKKPTLSVEKKDEFTNIIVSSSKQLIHIIDDIIEISRIESGLMKMNKTPFYLNTFFHNLTITLSQLIPKEKNIELNYISCDEINSETVINSDEVKLKQIMTNLIENAIKYTPSGSIEIGCLSPKSDKIIFYVKDTGIGISPENHKTIFERFRQINNELTWKYSGSGLGLAISKAYTEFLGGEIWLESELNQGSIFYISVPFETKINYFEKIDSIKSLGFSNLKKSIKILIAEDNELNFEYLYNLLIDYNFEILHAKDGIEAINIFKKHQDIELSLIDVKMPNKDGFETCTEILRINPNAKLIIQSAYSSQEDIDKSISIGCKAFICKPIDSLELMNQIIPIINGD